MSCDTYIALQGKIIDCLDYPFTLDNRAFLYGDQCFETIKIINQKPCFIDLHLHRLQKSTQIVQLDIDTSSLHKTIEQLILKNQVIHGRLKIMVYRSDGGKYMPKENTPQVLIMTYSGGGAYKLNPVGFRVGICETARKTISPLGFFKSSQSFSYILASLEREKRDLDELFILNDKEVICEAISSNIVAVKNNILYTPPLSDGCIAGIMRTVLFDISNRNQIKMEEKTLSIPFLKECDELFICNSQQGIQWIEWFDKKNYSNKMSIRMSAFIP